MFLLHWVFDKKDIQNQKARIYLAIGLNILVRFKNINFVDYKRIFKTTFKLLFISLVSIFIVRTVFNDINNFVCIIKIIAYLLMVYTTLYILRRKILF